MKKCLIIGAGQLGSRHLQGLVKYPKQLEIYVLDPSADSLKIAEEREKEIIHNNVVTYSQKWDNLPSFFDLVVVATSSNIREAIISDLLAKHTVRFLVLEKILFQELEAYQRVNELLLKNNVTTYVNHPRRMFQSYSDLKQNINENQLRTYNVVGGNWGLGCNALHFLDLFVYLSGKTIKEINVSYIDEELAESSRKGFIEFTGTLTGRLEDQSFFSITSFKGSVNPITVTICNSEQRFVIQEGGSPKKYALEKHNSFNVNDSDFNVQYQSELTTSIVAELFENNFCSLPTFEDARHTHELFIEAMLEKYNKITGLKAHNLPIT